MPKQQSLIAVLALPLFSGLQDTATFQSVTSLKCEFPTAASVNWERGEIRTMKQDFGFHIDAIDRKNSRARLIGNQGSADLTVLVSSDMLAFAEQAPTGAIQLTVVYKFLARNGEFKAVHSRHTASLGDAIPSQSYGTCKPWQ